MKEQPAVELFGYLDYRQFLADWFEAKKQANHRYSHRLFAKRAGVRSPSLLSEIIQGKRNLTPQNLDGFVKAMALDAEEARFFSDLVDLDQAPRAADRAAALQRVAASQRFRKARPLDRNAAAYLSHWYVPAIRELAFRQDFEADPAWIARQLQPEITPEEATEALETLLELGLLVRDEGGVFPGDATVATDHEVSRHTALSYHQQMIERAQSALVDIPAEERHLLAVTLAVPESLLPQLKAEANRFMERMLHLGDDNLGDAERVVQVNLQMIPLSKNKDGR